MKNRVLVVTPGRGTYTKESLGYLKKFPQSTMAFVKDLDHWRTESQELTVTELDSAPQFKNHVHTKGENASVLIFACSLADYFQLDREEYEVVAVTGNSMGWYTALVLASALNLHEGYQVINTMGSMMKTQIIGGQIIYPIMNEDWTYSQDIKNLVFDQLNTCNNQGKGQVYPSIFLGGYLVIGGDQEGLSWLIKNLPAKDHFPFQLINHAAFHTPLLRSTSEKAFQILSSKLFHSPKLPLIDGRGHIWSPYSSDPLELYRYTLGHQVVEPYDFTKAITVGIKEFAPDQIVLLGPGNSLGGSIGQILVNEKWQGISTKSDFKKGFQVFNADTT